MIHETIAAVQETEAQAEQIVKAAEQESEQILENAKKEAEAIAENAGIRTREQAALTLKKLQTDGEQALEKENQTVALEVEKLKEQAKSREKGAVELILSQLF